MPEMFDVALIGAGPAGATAATYFANKGFNTLILEKEQFPRFHIGESLLPKGIPVLLENGIDLEDYPTIALKKRGAQFFSSKPGALFRFDFANSLPGGFPHAYQVNRDLFDHLLASRAQAKGAKVLYGVKVLDWAEQNESIQISTSAGEFKSRYLIDASGQSSLMARKAGTKSSLRGLGKCASFTHYERVSSPKALEQFGQGDILVTLTNNQCWAWAIPLPDQRLSLGVVTKDGEVAQDPETELSNFIQQTSIINEILEGSSRCAPVRRIADFSFYNSQPFTKRTVALGDAFGFLDPIYSSGVTLGICCAQKLAKFVMDQIKTDRPFQLEKYVEQVSRAYGTFEKIVERFYRPGWVETTFFMEDKPAELVTQMTSILAGDVWRTDNSYQNLFLKGKRTSLKRSHL